ncbi:antitoxin [Butyricicoccus sp. AM28-25]|nr:antitoxin [Butyricicoccus sp. AM28-25]RHT78770.1 antitoxin [Butyricicoccus sp. AM28-25]
MNKNQYDSDFVKRNYDRVSFQVPKGGKDILKKECDIRGFSGMNALITNAILEAYGIDLRKKTEK